MKFSNLRSGNIKRKLLITGCNGHIGRSLIDAISSDEFEIYGIDLQGSASSSKVSTYISLDLSDLGRLEEESRNLGVRGFSAFVHLAALTGASQEQGWSGHLESQSLEVWNKTISINLTSAFIIARELFSKPQVDEASIGTIVLISSIYSTHAPDKYLYGENPWNNPAAYGVSKAGVNALTRYLAASLGPRVRANAIVSGGIARGQNLEFVERYEKKVPLKRMGTEAEIVPVIQFLLSDSSSYITGSEITVDGGFSII